MKKFLIFGLWLSFSVCMFPHHSIVRDDYPSIGPGSLSSAGGGDPPSGDPPILKEIIQTNDKYASLSSHPLFPVTPVHLVLDVKLQILGIMKSGPKDALQVDIPALYSHKDNVTCWIDCHELGSDIKQKIWAFVGTMDVRQSQIIQYKFEQKQNNCENIHTLFLNLGPNFNFCYITIKQNTMGSTYNMSFEHISGFRQTIPIHETIDQIIEGITKIIEGITKCDTREALEELCRQHILVYYGIQLPNFGPLTTYTSGINEFPFTGLISNLPELGNLIIKTS